MEQSAEKQAHLTKPISQSVSEHVSMIFYGEISVA